MHSKQYWRHKRQGRSLFLWFCSSSNHGCTSPTAMQWGRGRSYRSLHMDLRATWGSNAATDLALLSLELTARLSREQEQRPTPRVNLMMMALAPDRPSHWTERNVPRRPGNSSSLLICHGQTWQSRGAVKGRQRGPARNCTGSGPPRRQWISELLRQVDLQACRPENKGEALHRTARGTCWGAGSRDGSIWSLLPSKRNCPGEATSMSCDHIGAGGHIAVEVDPMA